MSSRLPKHLHDALNAARLAVGFAVALRNRIIHGYDRLENVIVLEAVRRDLPPLMAGLEQELSGFQPP